MIKHFQKLVLVDGHAILHRAYHAYPKTLITPKGELVNAVYGFTSILLSLIKELKPDFLAVAFDLKGPTFRHKQYKKYKGTRPKVDDELINQIDRVKQLVNVLNIPIFEKKGFEADDIIGTLTRQANENYKFNTEKITTKNKPEEPKQKKNLEVIIATGDRDALQLINSWTKVFIPGRGRFPAKMMGINEFKKEYGFLPRQLIDFKALAGDSADNIPGVYGIGPKKAMAIVRNFGSIENLYKKLAKKMSLPDISAKDIERLLIDKDKAFLSKKLATIVTNAPIKLTIDKCLVSDFDRNLVVGFFNELGFRSLVHRLPGEENRQEKKIKERGKSHEEKQMALF